MTVLDLLERHMDDDDARYYAALADMTVRQYLGAGPDEALPEAVATTYQVARILAERDRAALALASSGSSASSENSDNSVKSESMTEGSVSRAVTYETRAERAQALTEYDSAIQTELDKIRRFRRVRMPGLHAEG